MSEDVTKKLELPENKPEEIVNNDSRKPFNPRDYVNKSCKHCHGTGTYGRLVNPGKDPVSIMCSCVQKGMHKAMERAMRDGKPIPGMPGMLGGMHGRMMDPKFREEMKAKAEAAKVARETEKQNALGSEQESKVV